MFGRTGLALLLALLTAGAAGCAGRSAGAALEARFEAGNEAYEEGDYERAVSIYREVLSSGVRSPALHYNLGNALFKSGRLGEALLEYEKAEALDPGDPDVRDNLQYARSLTVDEISPVPSPLAAMGLGDLLGLTTPGQDAAVLAIFWLLSGAAFAVGVAARAEGVKRSAFYAAGALLLPAFLGGSLLALKSWEQSTAEYGVVLAAEADVLSGAGEDNPALFTVHEGLKVRIRSRVEGWTQVSLANGLTGWLPEGSIGEI